MSVLFDARHSQRDEVPDLIVICPQLWDPRDFQERLRSLGLPWAHELRETTLGRREEEARRPGIEPGKEKMCASKG